MSRAAYTFLADVLLVLHAAYVAFVVLGLVFIWVGYFLRLRAVRNLTFRILHLAAITIVAAQVVAGVPCPLTVWENDLRRLAGEGVRYEESFLEHWVGEILFVDWAPSTFVIVYMAFFLAVASSLIIVRPRRARAPPEKGARRPDHPSSRRSMSSRKK